MQRVEGRAAAMRIKEELSPAFLLERSGPVQAQRRTAETLQISPKKQPMDDLALNKEAHPSSNENHLQSIHLTI